MIESPHSPEALLEAMRTQLQTRRRLRELQALPHPTDEQRDEAWLLLRSIRRRAIEARRLRPGVSVQLKAMAKPKGQSKWNE